MKNVRLKAVSVIEVLIGLAIVLVMGLTAVWIVRNPETWWQNFLHW